MTKRALVLSVTVLLLTFCSLGYAADFNVTDTAGFQTALTTAQSNGEDDVITLSAGNYPTPVAPFSYNAASGEGSLVIAGVDSATVILDGQGTNQVLDINNYNGTDLTLRNLTIQNGSYTSDGGGAYLETSWGNLLVDNCIFQDNITNNRGGGLFATIEQNAVLTLNNSQFLSNVASDDSSGNEHGGGAFLEVEYGQISVKGNKFQGNSASDSAGALYADVDYVGDIDLKDNEFTDNHAENSYGGAAYLYIDYTGDMTLEGNLYEANTADDSDGGALYAYVDEVGNIFMTGDTFRNNEAYDDGGAAYLEVYYSGVIKVDSCDFTGNKSLNSEAGALFTYSDYGADAMITNSTFSGNMADDDGGALYAYVSEEGDVLIQNSTFDTNVSSSDGGGAYVDGYYGNVYVADSSFTNNTAAGDGAGIYAEPEYGNLWFSNNLLDGNTGTGDGGGAYLEIDSYGDLTIEANTFTNNNAEYGGGVYAYPYEGDFIFRNNVIANNTSSYEGGGIYVDSGYVRYGDIINNTITGNVVSEDSYYGGGIYLYGDVDGEIYNIYNNIIRGNSASAGDDIYIDDDENDIYFYLHNNNFGVLSQDITGTESLLFSGDNMDVDPLFVSATDFHLQAGSPVIGEGNNNAPSLPEIDLDGNARVYGGNVDMGAYEFGSGSTGDDDTTKSTSGGSSSGGCNAGAFSPALVMLLAPLLLLAGKK